MKFVILLFMFFFLSNCSKPKSVLICGDHVCVNKEEAKQYFEKNLTLEVKILDNKNKDAIEKIIDGSITKFIYDPTVGKLKERVDSDLK